MIKKIRSWFDSHLVPYARNWWRLWSIRLNGMGLTILGLFWFEPSLVLSVWNMMPVAVREAVPPSILVPIAFVLFGLAMLAALVKQPKLNRRWDDPK